MSSLLKRIIPCLDVDRGRVVKGVHFAGLRDMGDPVALAGRYADEGADEIVFLDISASAESRPTALAMVRQVSRTLAIPFMVGGGLRELDDIHRFLEVGADRVALNTSAVLDPELVSAASRRFGCQCLVVAVDFQKDDAGEYRIFTHGGRRPTGKTLFAWCRELADRGAGELLLTSIDRDGTGSGFDIEATAAIAAELPIPIIASGGAQHAEHLYRALIAGADAVLAATMFHSGAVTIGAVKQFLATRGIPVRLTGEEEEN